MSVAVSERNALAAAYTSGVTEDGLKLFLNLSKTLGRDVTWKGQDIIVTSTVLVKHPYRADNCCMVSESVKNDKMIAYVQQLVSRFWTDSAKLSNNSSNRPSPEKQVSPAHSSQSLQQQQQPPPPSQTSVTAGNTVPTAASIVAGTASKAQQPTKQQQQANGQESNLAKGVKGGSSGGTGTSIEPRPPSQGRKGSRNGS